MSPVSASPEHLAPNIERAAALLNAGKLVAFPTETVYGLGADAHDSAALRRIFEAKGRPSSHPLIVHVADLRQVAELVSEAPKELEMLAKRFWPGPLTLVLKKSQRVPHALTGGQDTVAIRVPAHPIALALLRSFGRGVAAPSANRFGAISPTTAEHVRRDLGTRVDLILDGGPCEVGVESTILDLSRGSPVVLRPGGVPTEALAECLGRSIGHERESSVRAPGQLASHYAPRAELITLEKSELASCAEALSARGARIAILHPSNVEPPRAVRSLAVPQHVEGYAHALYAALRELDGPEIDFILAVAPPETSGLGEAVLDRLARASAPRPVGHPPEGEASRMDPEFLPGAKSS